MKLLLILVTTLFTYVLFADDGYRLWLKYDLITTESVRNSYAAHLTNVAVKPDEDPTIRVIMTELSLAAKGMLSVEPKFVKQLPVNGAGLRLEIKALNDKNNEAYEITTEENQITISANSPQG